MTAQFDPERLSIPDRYKLLIGSIVPRPIAFVSSMGLDGSINLAPFSFFAGISSNPMSMMFCPANKSDGSRKDTLRNVLPPPLGRGEFVINVVSYAIRREMAACAEELPYGESEFELAGLNTQPGVKIAPPRVAESPVSFECVTHDIVELNPGAPAGGNIVIGRVVCIHMADGLVNERFHVGPSALDAIGRMGGQGYCTTRDRFEMPMGREALKS